MAATAAARRSGDAALLRDGVPFAVRASVALDVIAGLDGRHHQIKRHAMDRDALRPVLAGPGISYAAMDYVDRHADATVIFVPGARAFIHNVDKYLTEIMAVRGALAATPGSRTRVVAWAGHNAPGTDFLWTHDGVHVCAGGAKLADFITALRMEEGDDHRIILDGFSLGASIVAMAALVLRTRGEKPVAKMIMGGCPGVPFGDVADTGMALGDVFTHRSANDVCGCGVLGHDPYLEGASTSLDIPIAGIRHVPPRAIPGMPFDRYVRFLSALLAGDDVTGFTAPHRRRSRIELGGVGFRQLRRSRRRNLALYGPFLEAQAAMIPPAGTQDGAQAVAPAGAQAVRPSGARGARAAVTEPTPTGVAGAEDARILAS